MTTSEQIKADIEAMITDYRAAFSRYDLDGILQCYTLPNHFISDAEVVALMPITTADDCRAGVERVLAWHRTIGMASGRLVKLAVTELSPQLAVAYLDVELQDGEGRRLYDYQGFYTAVKTVGGWRIASIAHNQVPRLKACVAQVKASLGRQPERVVCTASEAPSPRGSDGGHPLSERTG